MIYAVFILVLTAMVVTGGLSFFRAVAALFWFGVITLPLGLWAKRQEKMIRDLRIDGSDPGLESTFRRWLEEWDKPRWKLSD